MECPVTGPTDLNVGPDMSQIHQYSTHPFLFHKFLLDSWTLPSSQGLPLRVDLRPSTRRSPHVSRREKEVMNRSPRPSHHFRFVFDPVLLDLHRNKTLRFHLFGWVLWVMTFVKVRSKFAFPVPSLVSSESPDSRTEWLSY